MTDYALLPKLLPAFRRLTRHYKNKGETDLCDLLESSRFHFEPGTEYDNWNGGTHGHDVVVFVPPTSIDLVDLDDQERVSVQVRDDLNKATPEIENEYVRAVYVKLADESDPQFRTAVPYSGEPYARPLEVGLWKANLLRIFLSHRDQYKSEARALADALEPYGVSTFVAHDAIKPMKEWQVEILNGLTTMEVMLVLLTEDFHESTWTNQEIGFALAKGTPIVCVKVGAVDPPGFIGSRQALKASLERISDAAPLVYRALIDEIGQESRLKEILIEAFVSSVSYLDTIEALRRLTETADHLSETELNRIIEGYAQNDQLYGCVGIHNRGNWFKQYLEDATGRKFEFGNRRITEVRVTEDDGIPF
ncbi:MAG: TIR domain-containing protein [Chloroflexi bacterium]|nr:TIR domain-containing protein [Chloroflexota bacterium]